MNIKISTSMLSADFAFLDRDLKRIAQSGADYLHVDVMDGSFVPNITIGPDQIANLRKCIDLPFDVHLMIVNPLKYIQRFAEAGSDIITFHLEVEDDANECIDLIHRCGKKAGIVIKPDTDVSEIKPYLSKIEMVLLMSVYPGFGGQSYIPQSTQRLKDARKMIGDLPVDLEVDGGVNFETLPTVISAGANVIVSGSCLFTGDMNANVKRFRSAF